MIGLYLHCLLSTNEGNNLTDANAKKVITPNIVLIVLTTMSIKKYYYRCEYYYYYHFEENFW